MAAQDWSCLICQRTLTWATAQIDHDHQCCPGEETCGKCTRGILCYTCNVGLGSFVDSAWRLRRAIDYLQGADSVTQMERAQAPWLGDTAPENPAA